MGRWIKQIRSLLEFLGRHLLTGTVVEVDADDRAETIEIVEECLPNGYQKVQCHNVGDLVFRRGRFSQDRGGWDEDGRPSGSWDA
jgi:hypothetical protein